MKKIFQIIGLISLTCFSFFITEKTVLVVNDLDEIMIQIKEVKDEYKSDYVDAIIYENTIIPGINGKVVNVNKSYKNMKINGYFSDKLFIYDYKKPSISLYDNMDKYIIKGNSNKRMVSLIFTLKSGDDIEEILNIINNYGVKASFFCDYNWYKESNDLVKKIINDGHVISPFFTDYADSDYEWMDMVIKKVNKQSVNFCYAKEYKEKNIDICNSRGNYIIKPTIISDKTPLVDIKSKLEAGSILSLSVSSAVRKELSTIIIYIKSKGYSLTNLKELILE